MLKSDKAFIAKSEPSSTLLQQMMDLQSDIDLNQGAPAVVSTSLLFFLENTNKKFIDVRSEQGRHVLYLFIQIS